MTKKYKCDPCFLIINEEDLLGGKCPVCQQAVKPDCELDHECHCALDITPGIHYCEKCMKPVCSCGAHNVFQLSRVTGYLQDVSGWNAGKKQELMDRNRYNL
jgi:hypothetical protein